MSESCKMRAMVLEWSLTPSPSTGLPSLGKLGCIVSHARVHVQKAENAKPCSGKVR